MFVSEEFPIDKIIAAMEIILDNNVFAFGDTYWKQVLGIAMGTPLTMVVATLFFAIKEIKYLLPCFSK